mmetsp:Transcript_11595/g.28143  ORF Transcript_11595/g.28143 Transcript_11595/m.28143 type:complete len:205 (+) Transcript_11595:9041-9655(+)
MAREGGDRAVCGGGGGGNGDRDFQAPTQRAPLYGGGDGQRCGAATSIALVSTPGLAAPIPATPFAVPTSRCHSQIQGQHTAVHHRWGVLRRRRTLGFHRAWLLVRYSQERGGEQGCDEERLLRRPGWCSLRSVRRRGGRRVEETNRVGRQEGCVGEAAAQGRQRRRRGSRWGRRRWRRRRLQLWSQEALQGFTHSWCRGVQARH